MIFQDYVKFYSIQNGCVKLGVVVKTHITDCAYSKLGDSIWLSLSVVHGED